MGFPEAAQALYFQFRNNNVLYNCMQFQQKQNKKARIFFIDDEKMMLDMYVMKFKSAGFDVVACDDSSSALQQIISFQPDIIFLDLVMAKEDGLNLLKKIKSAIEIKWIPVIMLSNIDNVIDKKECLKYGASNYLIKHRFQPSDLVAYAEEILAQV